MKRTIEFTKFAAAGNDFVLIDPARSRPPAAALPQLARAICDRKFGAGADGLLVVERSSKAKAKMRIFNSDGSEAEMCGNGARCFAHYLSSKMGKNPAQFSFETLAGLIKANVRGSIVKVQLTDPRGLKEDMVVDVFGRTLSVNFVDTGVPHAVIFVQGLAALDVNTLGRAVRFHPKFAPKGTNVDFVEAEAPDRIQVRTYERGVEAETLACGTGSVASALITARKTVSNVTKINVQTAGGEVLGVFFRKKADSFSDVWLEGEVRVPYKGEYYV